MAYGPNQYGAIRCATSVARGLNAYGERLQKKMEHESSRRNRSHCPYFGRQPDSFQAGNILRCYSPANSATIPLPGGMNAYARSNGGWIALERPIGPLPPARTDR